MFGSSRESLAALSTSLDARRDESGFDAVSGDLLAVAGLLGHEKSLRQTLADAGAPATARAGIARSLFADRLSPEGQAVVEDVVNSRWSDDRDLVAALEQLGAQAAFAAAERDGTLDRVEDELFTVGQAIEGSPDLQMALTNPALDGPAKASVVRDLLGDAASPITVALLTHLAAHPLEQRQPADAVTELARLASEQRQQVLAEVRTAVALTAQQHDRLAAALGSLQGATVRINVILDPEVVGGIVVRVGDDIIDGSVANRLEQARRAVSA